MPIEASLLMESPGVGLVTQWDKLLSGMVTPHIDCWLEL